MSSKNVKIKTTTKKEKVVRRLKPTTQPKASAKSKKTQTVKSKKTKLIAPAIAATRTLSAKAAQPLEKQRLRRKITVSKKPLTKEKPRLMAVPKIALKKPADSILAKPQVLKPKVITRPAPTPLPAAPIVIKPAVSPQISEEKPPVPKKEAASTSGITAAPLHREEPQEKPEPEVPPAITAVPKEEEAKIIEINLPVTLKDLAISLQEKPVALIKKLLDHKIIANLNFSLDEELAKKIALEHGYQINKKPTEEELLLREHEIIDASRLKSRPPIVTFMGHVDHGKTSLLDAIRKSKVAESEYGGITQHIGAYSVILPKGKITFLDTPGHEAFTAMRARGAKATDIVVLVVAADDGIMPQTIEAVDHAKEAQAPIVAAINKIDKPQINIDLIKKQLSELGLNPEDWGGKTITVGVSAKTGQGINELLEMILLEAQMLELTADPQALARGIVLEAKTTEGRGPVVTLLVENGTLRPQDAIIVGPYYAKVRAMFNEYGKQINEALPSTPVEILGLSGLPEAGEKFFVLSDEKKAKELAAKRKIELRERGLRPIKMMSLEDLSKAVKEGKVKELKLILKADVGGSLEAINESLKKLATSEVKLNIIHQGLGSINVSDVILAQASNAIIMGFHVGCDERSNQEVNKSGIDIRTYNVIYELVNDLKTALEGLLEPKLKKIFLGRLIVRQVFKLTKAGVVAGCYVEKGKIIRSAQVSLLRNAGTVHEGSIQSLKRFKDDVREASEGMECGVSLAGFSDIMVGDVIEAYDIEKIARKL